MNNVFMGFSLNEIIGIREICEGHIHRQVDEHSGLHITANGTGDYTEVTVRGNGRIFVSNKKLAAAGITFGGDMFTASIKELFIKLAIEVSVMASLLHWVIEQEDFSPVFVSVSKESQGFTVTEDKEGDYLFCGVFHGKKVLAPFLPDLGELMGKTIPVKWLDKLDLIDDSREIDMNRIEELYETLRLF